MLEQKGATGKAGGLRVWLAGLVSIYEDKVLPFDASAAALAGRLEARAILAGHDPGMADAALAGIASARDLVVITRNTKHFGPFGIDVAAPGEL